LRRDGVDRKRLAALEHELKQHREQERRQTGASVFAAPSPHGDKTPSGYNYRGSVISNTTIYI
jgi:hypothetical protein